jgi:phage baseplate assembly protein W
MTAPTRTDPFGRSLLLNDGDLVLDGGQLVEIEGIANLRQALTLRILTPLGSDRFNTRYGLDLASAFTEPSGIRMVKELVKLNLVSTLGTDPRVREVHQVTFDDDPSRLAGEPNAAQVRAAHHRRSWTVEVELDTVAGNTVTLLVDVEV